MGRIVLSKDAEKESDMKIKLENGMYANLYLKNDPLVLNFVISEAALKNTFSEYVLVLKQYKEFDSSLKNVRGLAKSLKQFEDLTIAEQKKIINQSKKKKWKNFYEVKEKKTAQEKTIKQVVGKNSRRKSY